MRRAVLDTGGRRCTTALACAARRVACGRPRHRPLPATHYRQWTLSFPHWLRRALVQKRRLLPNIRRLFLDALGCYYRRKAKEAGVTTTDALFGGVAFTQRFGSALQLNPHLHVLVPDGVFLKTADSGAAFIPLSPPTDDDVEAVLTRLMRKLHAKLTAHQADDEADFETEWAGLQDAAAAKDKSLFDDALPLTVARKPLVAQCEGFSLHAGTKVHAHDEEALLRLCYYGARGAFAHERLTRLSDGRLSYKLKRPLGVRTALILDGPALLKKLAALVPPPRAHLTHYFGVFSSHHHARSLICTGRQRPQPAGPKGVSPRGKAKKSRVDWATLLKRTFALDVFRCPRCGGKRRVVQVLKTPEAAQKYLKRKKVGYLLPGFAPARAPPQTAFWA